MPGGSDGSPANVSWKFAEGRYIMGILGWTILFFVIAVVAALFGFTGIATAAAGIAQILFFIFLALFIVFLIAALFGRHTHPPHHPG
jgi:uncharacterized membrane protein YtjA (UPF0391 family)